MSASAVESMNDNVVNTILDDDWDNEHLSNIDPSLSTVPAGFYNLRVNKVTVKSFTKKADGTSFRKIFVTYVIVDNPDYSGRKVSENYFWDAGLKHLKLIQDNAGVEQADGEKLTEWMKRLVAEGCAVRLYVGEKPDLNFDGTPNPGNVKGDGSAGTKNFISWHKGIAPAEA
jgi:hypothetical protein